MIYIKKILILMTITLMMINDFDRMFLVINIWVFISFAFKFRVETATTQKNTVFYRFLNTCVSKLWQWKGVERKRKKAKENEETKETSEKRKLIQIEWNTNKPTNQPINQRTKRKNVELNVHRHNHHHTHLTHLNCNITFISGLFRITTCSRIKKNKTKPVNQPIWIRLAPIFVFVLPTVYFNDFRFIQFYSTSYNFLLPFFTLLSFWISSSISRTIFVRFCFDVCHHNFRVFVSIDIFRMRF